MNFERENFLTNPFFKFKEIITEKNEGFGTSSMFEVIKHKNGETYLLSPYLDIKNPYSHFYHISLISLKDNQEKQRLEGHIDRIKVIRHFIDQKTSKEYLISVDRKFKIIVWFINDNFSKIFNKIIKFGNLINDVLMFFINGKIFIAVSAMTTNGYTKIININDNNEVYEIKDSWGLIIYNLSYWYNKNDENHYIIQCGKCKIIINEYQDKGEYDKIETPNNYPINLGSIVYTRNKRDYLSFSSTFGLIYIYDLLDKNEVKKFDINKSFLINIVKWNEKYLITIDINIRRILIIDLDINKIINSIKIKQIFSHERFVRKIIHPLYGEALMSIGNDYKVKLYININYKKYFHNLNYNK